MIYLSLGFIGIAFVIVLVALISTAYKESKELDYGQKSEMEKMNKPYKCKCGIVSRKYQLKGDKGSICPHCEHNMDSWINYKYYGLYNYTVSDDRDFPFAPKLTEKEFLKIEKQNQEIAKIKKEMQDLEEKDKEIEAWENLQLKKLAHFEKEAERIKKELSL